MSTYTAAESIHGSHAISQIRSIDNDRHRSVQRYVKACRILLVSVQMIRGYLVGCLMWLRWCLAMVDFEVCDCLQMQMW